MWHTPCEIGCLLDGLCCCVRQSQPLLDLHVLEKAELPGFTCRFLWAIFVTSTTEVEFGGTTRGHFFMDKGVRQGCLASGVLFAMVLDPSMDGSTIRSSQETLLAQIFLILVRVLVIFRWVLRPSDHCWPPCLRPLWWWAGWQDSTTIIGSVVHSMAGWRQNICFVCAWVFGIHIRTRWSNRQEGGPCVAMNHFWFFFLCFSYRLLTCWICVRPWYLGSISSSLLPGLERPPTRAHSPTVLRQCSSTIRRCLVVRLYSPIGKVF